LLEIAREPDDAAHHPLVVVVDVSSRSNSMSIFRWPACRYLI